MRDQVFILLATVFLWGCEVAPVRVAPIGPDGAARGGGHPYIEVVWRDCEGAWVPPRGGTERVTKVSIAIARNGRVVSAKIVTPSGDVLMDKSVRAALDKVRLVQPFEKGAKEDQRTFVINFRLEVQS